MGLNIFQCAAHDFCHCVLLRRQHSSAFLYPASHRGGQSLSGKGCLILFRIFFFFITGEVTNLVSEERINLNYLHKTYLPMFSSALYLGSCLIQSFNRSQPHSFPSQLKCSCCTRRLYLNSRSLIIRLHHPLYRCHVLSASLLCFPRRGCHCSYPLSSVSPSHALQQFLSQKLEYIVRNLHSLEFHVEDLKMQSSL